MQNDQQIEVLIARFFTGEATPEEAMQLEDWVVKSPVNKSYFESFFALFPVLAPGNEGHDKLRAWEIIEKTIIKKQVLPKVTLRMWPRMRVAVLIIFVVAIGFVTYTHFKKANSKFIYQTGSSSRKIVLPDNSEVVIAPNSAITLSKDFGNIDRRINLSGSAYFSVVHNPVKLFEVDIDQLHIKDLGTRFNVRTSLAGDTVFIDVDEGSVFVYDDFNTNQKATAGEKLIYVKPQKKLIAFHTSETKTTVDTPKATKNSPAPITKNKTPRIVPSTDVPVVNTSEKNNPLLDSLKGSILFECSSCAEKAQLEFVSVTDKTRTISNFDFIKTESPPLCFHKEFLNPGDYNWFYTDQNNKKTKGIARVTKNEQVKVILFEHYKSKAD